MKSALFLAAVLRSPTALSAQENRRVFLDSTCYAQCAEAARIHKSPIGPPELPILECEQRLRAVAKHCFPDASEPLNPFADLVRVPDNCAPDECSMAYVKWFWGCQEQAAEISSDREGLSTVLEEFNSLCDGAGAEDLLLLSVEKDRGCNHEPLNSQESNAIVGMAGDCCSACEDEFEPTESLELIRDGALHRGEFSCGGNLFCYKAYDLDDNAGNRFTDVWLYYFSDGPTASISPDRHADEIADGCLPMSLTKDRPLRLYHSDAGFSSVEPGQVCKSIYYGGSAHLAETVENLKEEVQGSVIMQLRWGKPLTVGQKVWGKFRSLLTPNFLGPGSAMLFSLIYMYLRFHLSPAWIHW